MYLYYYYDNMFFPRHAMCFKNFVVGGHKKRKSKIHPEGGFYFFGLAATMRMPV